MVDFVALLLQVIPISLVAAISPTTFAAIIVLMSLSEKPKTTGAGFLTGSLIVVVLAAVLGLVAGESTFYLRNSDSGPLKAGIDLVLGIIVLLYGIKVIVQKKTFFEGDELNLPQKNKSRAFDFVPCMLLAMGMFALNFITTFLVFMGGSKIAMAGAGGIATLLSIIILVSISLVLVELPVLIYFLTPQKADKILFKLNNWIKKNGYYLTAILIIVIGLYLLSNGLSAFGWI